MVEKELKVNSLFLYNEDIELMFAALNLLMGEKKHQLTTVVYGEQTISALKRKYHFLFELFQGVNRQTGIFELLLDYPMQGFRISEFQDYLIHIEPKEFVERYLEIDDHEVMEVAFKSYEGLKKFYFDHPDVATSFLGLQSLFRDTKQIIIDYFSFAEELRTELFQKEVERNKTVIETELLKCKNSLEKMEPLEYSQLIMGKTFFNRGPYSEFIFMPSLFVPFKAIRFFSKIQILFYSIRQTPIENEVILKQLKTIADDTRLKIISLLNEKEPLRGIEIADVLSLASSTVSHHMEQLKNAGLINEEQVKNSKYYSINRNSVNDLLKLLTDTLSKSR